MKKLLLALVGFFFVLSASSETIPATATNHYWYSQRVSSCGSSQAATCDWSSAIAADCTAYSSTNGWSYNGVTGDEPTVGVSPGYSGTYTCKVLIGSSPSTISKSVFAGAVYYSCPSGQGWTLTGTQCVRQTCQAGQTLVNGVCICDNGAQAGNDGTCCPVAGSGGGAPMQWCYVDLPTATNCDSAGTNGCKVRCNNVTFQKGTGNTLTIWPKQALGQNCSYTGTRATNQGGGPLNNDELGEVSKATADPGKAKTPEGCLAAGMGYITGSGGTSCVGGGDTSVTKSETGTAKKSDGTETETTKTSEKTPTGGTESETTSTKNPDGSTTTTTKTTTCKDDGTCSTETKTTTKDAQGNQTSNKTDTNNDSLSKFCASNPESPMCKGFSDTCKDHPERVACRDLGNSPEGGVLETKEVSPMALNPVSLASNDTCPQGTQLPHGLGFYNWEPICDYASAMKPLILAFAWISAAFIVFAWKKD